MECLLAIKSRLHEIRDGIVDRFGQVQTGSNKFSVNLSDPDQVHDPTEPDPLTEPVRTCPPKTPTSPTLAIYSFL